MVEHLSDEQLARMRLGGHDPIKVYAAYNAALEHQGSPTVILAKTIKGYGLGESGEGKNITHQQKKINDEELMRFRSRFGIPIPDEQLHDAPFYCPPPDSPEIVYLQEKRRQLGGYLPERKVRAPKLAPISDELFEEFYKGTEGRKVSTTMVIVRMIAKMVRDHEFGKLIVPIVPDEARTFGMEALFRQIGIYSSVGQLVRAGGHGHACSTTKKPKTGRSWRKALPKPARCRRLSPPEPHTPITASTPSRSLFSIPCSACSALATWCGPRAISARHGFLLGGTAGRTTLAGEGLQHQDGNSQLLAYPVPNLVAYDPAFAYELAIIVQDGIRRMYVEQEDIFYYITVMNEPWEQPQMPPKACATAF